MISLSPKEMWRERLILPNYQIGEAAKYANISAQTVAAWHREDQKLFAGRDDGAALSYLQLIEVAVVAAFRRAKIKLPKIRKAREYLKREFKAEYPFAQYKFKSDGKHLLLDYKQFEGDRAHGHLLVADEEGQLEWDKIIAPLLKEFDYQHKDIVVRWHVDGLESPIIIDPRINFGSPSVRGTPTWILAGRWQAGESDADIADDFGLTKQEVKKALQFEDLSAAKRRKPSHLLH
jgi:uncharacterized protein (DUF433 family)